MTSERLLERGALLVALLAGLSCGPHATPPADVCVERRDDRPRDPLGEGFNAEPGYPKSFDVEVNLGPRLLTDSVAPRAEPKCPEGQRCTDLALGAMEMRTLHLVWPGLDRYARLVRALDDVRAPSHVLPSAAEIRRQLGVAAKATLWINLGKANVTQGADGGGEVCLHTLEERVVLRINGLEIPGWEGKGLELKGSRSTDSTTTQGRCRPEGFVGEPPPRCPRAAAR